MRYWYFPTIIISKKVKRVKSKDFLIFGRELKTMSYLWMTWSENRYCLPKTTQIWSNVEEEGRYDSKILKNVFDLKIKAWTLLLKVNILDVCVTFGIDLKISNDFHKSLFWKAFLLINFPLASKQRFC